MVTRKQPATIIQPQPPSGGEADRDLFTFAMVSIPFFFFFQLIPTASYDLGKVCCPVTSFWHSKLA
jgi:hypothetical protein